MTPDPEIRLKSMIKALEQIVAPAISSGNPLAVEQLGIVIGHLNLLRAQWPHMHQFAKVGLEAALALREDVRALIPAGSALALSGDGPDIDEQSSTSDIMAARDAIAAEVAALVERVGQSDDDALWERLSAVVLRHEAMQHRRNRVWFAGTGMDPAPETLPTIKEIVEQGQ